MLSDDRAASGPAAARRPLRADAERNQSRVLEAAHRVLRARGADATMRDVAAEAGVGVGTLYRNFPDKQALIAAVVESRFRSLTGEAEDAADTLPPWDAFALVMRRMAEMMIEDRAFAGAIGSAHPDPGVLDSEPTDVAGRRDRSRAALDAALRRLETSAREAGELRTDVGPLELGMLLAGVVMTVGPPGAPGPPIEGPDAPWERYLSVVLDGLRVRH